MPEFHIRRRVGFLFLLLTLPVLLYLAVTRGLYFFPTSVALGPCLPDWTNSGTYSALLDPPASPMGTTRFKIAEADIQICYGRPSARGRQVFESTANLEIRPDSERVHAVPAESKKALVPNGRLWRFGANEPTRIFTNRAIEFGDVRLDPGRYSFYAEPGNDEWKIFVTRSTFHWGNMINGYVRSREIGATVVNTMQVSDDTETLTFSAEELTASSTLLTARWANKRIDIPIRLMER